MASIAKNHFGVRFKPDYANYYPDFIVKLADGRVIVVETKGREDVDAAPKMRRLWQWCEDVNSVQGETVYGCVYVDEESFRTYQPKTFQQLLDGFAHDRRQYNETQN